MLLPGGDTHHDGWLRLSLRLHGCHCGLLLTTSFLGLRRYLRHAPENARHHRFWLVKFGAGVAGLVLAIALLLPRPGINDTWQTCVTR